MIFNWLKSSTSTVAPPAASVYSAPEGKFFDFIEIGTSDFDSLIQEASDSDVGLSIEPIALYLDRLPQRQKCIKYNCAVSNREDQAPVHFVSPENIELYNLPSWVKGCNTIGAYHPSVLNLLTSQGIDPELVFCSKVVPVRRLVSILQEFNVAGIYLLKVDTEGHDAVILEDFFSSCPSAALPHRVQFESNSLVDPDSLHRLFVQMIQIGYEVVRIETESGSADSIFRLNLHKMTSQSGFSGTLPGYYLGGYPAGYNPTELPHANELDAAQDYCAVIGGSGVTRQYGRYEVRAGKHLLKSDVPEPVASWIYI